MAAKAPGADKKAGAKRREGWKYMCIHVDVSDRLDAQRELMAHEMGVKKLSWTMFFAAIAKKLEDETLTKKGD